MQQWKRSMRLIASVLGLLVLAAGLRPVRAQTVVYQWNPTNLYNQTHPASGTNPYNWDTDWVTRPSGGQSLRVTVPSTKSSANYYEFIVVNPGTNLLQSGQEYRASIQFEISTSAPYPNYFFMYRRNTTSNDYDVWRKFDGDPGETRTIDMPMDLKTYGTGTWSFKVGMKGPGSIIIDSFKITTGSGYTSTTAPSGGTPVSILPSGVTVATGGTAVSITPPATTPAITIDAANYGLTADAGSPVSQTVAAANYTAFQNAINACATQNATKLTVPAGTYRFYASDHFNLDSLDDLTIDGQGAEFIFTRLRTNSEHFMISNCNRLVIKNLKIDWDNSANPIATLGQVHSPQVVTNAGVKTTSFDITFPDIDATQTLKITNGTTKWMSMAPFDSVKLVQNSPEKNSIGSSTALTFTNVTGNTAHVSATPLGLNLVDGGYYCVRHLYYEMVCFKIASSTHVLFDTDTIYSHPGMGWLLTTKTHHVKLLNTGIARRTGSRNPLTTAADGFHVEEAQGSLEINTCNFTGSGDDTINIHENCWQGGIDIANSGSMNLRLLHCPKNSLRLEPGQVLAFYAPDYTPLGVTLTIATVTYVGANNGYDANTYADVTFTTAAPANLSGMCIIRNLAYGNTNVRIVGNTIQYTNGRGILISGDNVTISSNYMRAVFGTAIQFHTEIVDNLWAEGHGANNVVIKSNTFENDNGAGRADGAVISADPVLPYGPTSNPLFQTILVDSNVFYNAPGPSMSFKSCKNVVARSNDIRISQNPPGATRYSGCIFAANSSYMALGGNTWRFLANIPADPAVVLDPGSTSVVETQTNAQVNQY